MIELPSRNFASFTEFLFCFIMKFFFAFKNKGPRCAASSVSFSGAVTEFLPSFYRVFTEFLSVLDGRIIAYLVLATT